jgi:hypothetical protein
MIRKAAIILLTILTVFSALMACLLFYIDHGSAKGANWPKVLYPRCSFVDVRIDFATILFEEPGDDPFGASHPTRLVVYACRGRIYFASARGLYVSIYSNPELIPRGQPISVPIRSLIPAFAGLPGLCVLLVSFRWWRRHHMSPGHCHSCGYDLTANTSGVCPECGEII